MIGPFENLLKIVDLSQRILVRNRKEGFLTETQKEAFDHIHDTAVVELVELAEDSL